MNPIILNCILVYITVVLLSLLQSRFRIYKDSPFTYILLLIITPVIAFGKAKNIKTWTSLTSFEAFAYTLMLAFFFAKRIVPKVNEGYIYAYTLFHWYLLIDSISLKGFNLILTLVLILSIIPTTLVIKSSLERIVISQRVKIILYYWFLFTIVFTYLTEVFLNIITPVFKLTEFSAINTIIILGSGLQLYFICTMFSLIFVGIPVFHLDKGSEPFKTRWKKAIKEWKKILSYKLANYIDYQISGPEFFLITIISIFLFYVDFIADIRGVIIFIYTVLIPIFFFYLKYSPQKNID